MNSISVELRIWRIMCSIVFVKPKPFELTRPQVVRDFADFVDRQRSSLGNFSQMLAGGIVFGERVQTDQRPVFNDQQVLTQAVVQFAGETFAFALLRFDESPRKSFALQLLSLQLNQPARDGKSCDADYCD